MKRRAFLSLVALASVHKALGAETAQVQEIVSGAALRRGMSASYSQSGFFQVNWKTRPTDEAYFLRVTSERKESGKQKVLVATRVLVGGPEVRFHGSMRGEVCPCALKVELTAEPKDRSFVPEDDYASIWLAVIWYGEFK